MNDTHATGALPIANLDDSGTPPKTRLGDYGNTQSIVSLLIRGDSKRNEVRARVKGLVDGNAPYSATELKNSGQSYRCNVNFRGAEAYLTLALTSFYDLISDATTYATVKTAEGDADVRDEWSRVITEEFDRMQRGDESFDFLVQLSQHDMVMYGTGPVVWEDETDWRCRTVESGKLLVPDRTRANLCEWEMAAVRCGYTVGELYKRIADAKAAADVGWNVECVREAILQAMPDMVRKGHDWEFHQSQIRNNDIYYSTQCATVQVAHVFVKEFSGKISQAIVLETGGDDYLFKAQERFDDWSNVLNPFYFDKGDGRHHSVKGLGVKMYGALEIMNRLSCSTVDASFALAQTMLQPATARDSENLAIVQMGPYAIIPPNVSIIQRNTPGVLDAPLAMGRELEQQLQSNLAQYRTRLEKPQGNPRTAYEVQQVVSQMATVGATQLSRYYQQLDAFYAERYRRAVSPKLLQSMPGGEEAHEFRRRCLDRGVPAKALTNVECVQAARTIGSGSASMRSQVLSELVSMAGALPEKGRNNVIKDWVAARVGQSKVQRYMPEAATAEQPNDHAAWAALENAVLKVGAPVFRTATQNDFIHAEVHMQAADAAAGSLQQGGNPMEVTVFLDAVGAHVTQHLAALSKDPTRRQQLAGLEDQWKKLAQVNDELHAALAQQQEQAQRKAAETQAAQQQVAAIQSGVDPETQIKAAQAQSDMKIKAAKATQQMALKEEKTKRDMAMKDAVTAAKVATLPVPPQNGGAR